MIGGNDMRKFTILCLLTAVCWLPAIDAVGQMILEGTVMDASTNSEFVGANVYIKNTTTGTITDANGSFRLSVPKMYSDSVLVVSFIGYSSQEMLIGNQRQFSITLETDDEMLSEVVVLGYTSQDREKVTGAISSVGAKELTRVPVASAQQALQGRAPGVSVTQNTGAPGEGVSVRIRGVGSINSSNEPLYVIDGIPTTDALNSIAPQDIESMTILKDASAAAIYGSRASNGVVVVTTKKGTGGAPRIQVNSQIGVQYPSRLIEMANTSQYVEIYNEAALGDNATKANPLFHRPIISEELAATLPDVDHVAGIFREGSEALLQSHSVTITGGEGKTQYLLSGSYFDEKGTIVGSGFDRITGRANISTQIKPWLKAGVNVNIARSNTDFIASSGDGAGGNGGSIIRYAFFRTPAVPVRQENGDYVDLPDRPDLFGDGYNPVGLAEYASNRQVSDRYFNKIFVEITPRKNWVFTSNLGIDFNNVNRRRFDRNWGTNDRINNPNRLEVFNARYSTITNNNVLNYTAQIADRHGLNIALGTETIKSQGYETIVSERDFPDQESSLIYLGNGQGGMVLPFETRYAYSLLSFFGKVDYDFDEKYIASVTLRRDGSSRFSADNRWGTFYAGSLGWRLDKEGFLQNTSWLDRWLVRAGYGAIGNQEIGNYAYSDRISPNYNYTFGNQVAEGFAVSELGNNQVQWETSTQLNIGTDIELLNGRVAVALDYFEKITSDMLVKQPIAASSGFAAPAWVNNGKVLNRGVELAINYSNNYRDFNYSITGNVATLHNEVLELAAPIQGGAVGSQFITRTAVGQPVGAFYLYEMEGIFQDNAEIFTHANQGTNIRPGDVKFKDQNGDGIIDENDRAFVGSAIPNLTAGLNLDLNYGNWDLSVFFQGAFGNKIFSVLNRDLEGFYRAFNVTERFYNERWTGPGTSDMHPRASWDASGNNAQFSTRFLEDGSYVRLKNLQLGYVIPGRLLERYGFARTRIYFSGYNVLTFTNYQGLDPEMTVSDNARGEGDRSAGLDWGTYPAPKSYNMGINFTF